MRLVLLAPLFLSALARSELTLALTPAQVPGFRIWAAGQQGVRPGPGPQDVTFSWGVTFKNETPREIGSATVRFVAMEGGRRIFVSPPATLSRFVNAGVAHGGSLLPYEKSEGDGSLRFTMPARFWRSDTVMDLELVSVTSFLAPDLHDAGHLYTRLHAGRGGSNVALFKRDPSLLQVRNAQGTNVSLMAFGCCDVPTIRYVLAHGGSAKSRTERGATIMHLAAMNGWPGVLDLARSLGGDVNAKTATGRTPLMKAIKVGQLPAWRWLLAHGARTTDFVPTTGESAPSIAIVEGQAQALADLVRARANPRWRDPNGDGWLEFSLKNDVFMDEVGKYHLPIDARNPKTGMTPLMHSARHNGGPTSAWLLRHGANPDLRDPEGRNCYDLARLSNTLRTDRFFRALVEEYRAKR